MQNRWRSECDCYNCAMVEHIVDLEMSRDGDYCIPTIMGKKTIHADDDFVVRCDCYKPVTVQTSLFEEVE